MLGQWCRRLPPPRFCGGLRSLVVRASPPAPLSRLSPGMHQASPWTLWTLWTCSRFAGPAALPGCIQSVSQAVAHRRAESYGKENNSPYARRGAIFPSGVALAGHGQRTIISMYKITFYVPSDAAEAVKQAMFAAGAGHIGGYDCCCWQCSGQGQFRPLAGSNPTIGSHGDITRLEELQVEMVCADACIAAAIAALRAAHPYETPAFAYWRVNDALPTVPAAAAAPVPAAVPPQTRRAGR